MWKVIINFIYVVCVPHFVTALIEAVFWRWTKTEQKQCTSNFKAFLVKDFFNHGFQVEPGE